MVLHKISSRSSIYSLLEFNSKIKLIKKFIARDTDRVRERERGREEEGDSDKKEEREIANVLEQKLQCLEKSSTNHSLDKCSKKSFVCYKFS